MQEIKTYADITKAANSMQREREIKAELNRRAPLIDHARFEQSFNEIFLGDETFETPKHKTVVDIHADHGVSIHDF